MQLPVHDERKPGVCDEEGRRDEGAPSPRRCEDAGCSERAVVQATLSLIATVAESRQHEALTTGARALALLYDLAVLVHQYRRR